MQVNQRVSRLKPSSTLALNQKANALKASGKSVINLTVGEPDVPTPERICNAAIAAIQRGETKYTSSTGISPLKEAVIENIQKTYGRSYEKNEVMISAGAKQAIYNLCLATLNEGDEAIIFAPYWVSYVEMVRLAGAIPVIVNSSEENGFEPKRSDLEKAISSKTRILFLNSPCNPTGTVYSEETLKMIFEVVEREKQIVVATDDIYEKFLYDGIKFQSIASFPSFPKEQLVIVHGVSKSYSMTGWRIGYAIAPSSLISAMDVIQSNATSNPTSISQWAAVEALRGDQKEVEEMKAKFEQRRNRFYPELIRDSKARCLKPKGAFYFFPYVGNALSKLTPQRHKIEDDLTLSDYLLMDWGLATVPGSAFGAPGYLRISFAASETDLKEGVERFHSGLNALE